MLRAGLKLATNDNPGKKTMVKVQRYPQGTSVRVRPSGAYPFDPKLVDRTGLVLHHHKGGQKYGVQLDGEEFIRAFDESELEPLASDAGEG